VRVLSTVARAIAAGRSRWELQAVSSAVATGTGVPPLPTATIGRPRLLAALDAQRNRALTLVGAPPGWGKTVLLSDWAAARGAAWLTLGRRHCDPSRLWEDVVAALATVEAPVLGLEAPLGTLDEEFPLRLADALADADDRPTLVLDDLHVLRGPALAGLGELVAHGGGAVRLVASTRSDPALPLERLRVSGRLGELRAAELAFTLDETAALLRELGLELRDDQVARLLERTEGWAAGLRFAGLSLIGEADRDGFIAAFAGDDRAVADYLTGEVLAGQPEAIREFLLRTSIADRVCGGLADALTGRSDGARTLEQLDRAGMFAAPLDRNRTWFRYHGLFAELLRARLRLEHPRLEPELHARAAEWLAASEMGSEAIPHVLAAGTSRTNVTLLADHWLELLLDGRAPEAVIAASSHPGADARLHVAGAAAYLSLGDPAGALALLDGVDAAGTDAGAFAALLRARARGNVSGARRAAAPLLDGTPARRAPGRADDARRALALYQLGAAEFEGGRPEAAAERLEGAAAIAVDGERQWLLLGCLGRAAALELAEGRLRRAESAARAVLALAEPRGWHRTGAAAWAYASLAAVHWHRDEIDDAERRADAAAAAAYAAREERALIAVRALRAHLAAGRGELDRARGLLRLAHEALARGGPVTARWLESLGPAPWGPEETRGPIAEAASSLARGDPLAALRRVERLAAVEPALHPVLRLHAELVEALARHRLGQLDAGAQSFERALAIAAGEGYRRPFVSALPVRRLLERHLGRPTAYGPLVAELLDALAKDADLPLGLLEPLSERERAVLRLLPTLLSYPEIAGELFVSVNTVKTHVKSIYRKLDVTGRREAVARARGLRLI
jgi:LuxR family maltose regulon positive regulatory protein